MTNPTDEPFVFKIIDFSFLDKGEWTWSNEPELRLLGRLERGIITKGDFIIVPTENGSVTGLIAQFMERLDGWDALPFYDRLEPESASFCLAIMGIPSNSVPLCPGTAHFVVQEPLVPEIIEVSEPDDYYGEFIF